MRIYYEDIPDKKSEFNKEVDKIFSNFGLKNNDEISANCIPFILPIEKKEDLPELFKLLEEQIGKKYKYQVSTISLFFFIEISGKLKRSILRMFPQAKPTKYLISRKI